MFKLGSAFTLGRRQLVARGTIELCSVLVPSSRFLARKISERACLTLHRDIRDPVETDVPAESAVRLIAGRWISLAPYRKVK